MACRIFLLIISLSSAVPLWLTQGNAEDITTPEDSQQISVTYERDNDPLVGVVEFSGETSQETLQEGHVQKNTPAYNKEADFLPNTSSKAPADEGAPEAVMPAETEAAPEEACTEEVVAEPSSPKIVPSEPLEEGPPSIYAEKQEEEPEAVVPAETEAAPEEGSTEEVVAEPSSPKIVPSEPLEEGPPSVYAEKQEEEPEAVVPAETEAVPEEGSTEEVVAEPSSPKMVPSEPLEEGPPSIYAEKQEEEPEAVVPAETEAAPEEGSTEEVTDLKPSWDIWHTDPIHGVLIAIVITLIAAKTGAFVARKLQLPSIVGSLLAGVLLGNIYTFTGWGFFDFLRTMPFLTMIAYFGTLLLLFTAGLHTDIRMLLRAGVSAFFVCVGGIAVTAYLVLTICHFLLPDAPNGTKVIVTIIMCSTGMGLITAVLSELKVIDTKEWRILIGAAVLTEIVVILTFGLVCGFVVRGGTPILHIFINIGIAIAFLVIAFISILKYSERFGNFLTKKASNSLNIPIIVILSLSLAFMTGTIGLHTVIGAFVAGLFLRNIRLKELGDKEYRTVESFTSPFYKLLVPILFVKVGAQVHMESLFSADAALLGFTLTCAVVAGKMFGGFCPIEKGVNRFAVGMGMAIKMEGTLIMAEIARDIGILDNVLFSSIIMVMMFTAIACPSFLRASLLKNKHEDRENIPVATENRKWEGGYGKVMI